MRHLSLALVFIALIVGACSGPTHADSTQSATLSGETTSTPTATDTDTDGGEHCGAERWSVKTISDDDASKVNTAPLPASVASLRAIDAPAVLPASSRVAPVELTTYWVLANVVEFKLEEDRDIHVVISDVGDPSQTMIVEFPDASTCSGATASVDASQMLSARTALIAAFGGPSSSRFTPISGIASFVGVGFFDFQHGQTGVAPNAIELHPVLSFSLVGASPTSTATATSIPTATPQPPTATPTTTSTCGAPRNPWGYGFCRGSVITAPATNFCSYFPCIASFWDGRGYVIECADGDFGKSGGIRGSCSHHGGNSRVLYAQ